MAPDASRVVLQHEKRRPSGPSSPAADHPRRTGRNWNALVLLLQNLTLQVRVAADDRSGFEAIRSQGTQFLEEHDGKVRVSYIRTPRPKPSD